MYKNNDEIIAWEAKKLLDEGVYTDTEQAYLDAEKIVIHIREQAKQRQVKQQFKLKIRSINKNLTVVKIMLISLMLKIKNIGRIKYDNKNDKATNRSGSGTFIFLGS